MVKGLGRDAAIIFCALNGEHTDASTVPISADELAAASRRAVDAGAAIVHVHVRDPRPAHRHRPLLDAREVEYVVRRIRGACPEVVISLGLGADTRSAVLLGVVGERDWADLVDCRPLGRLGLADDESRALFDDTIERATLSVSVARWLVECVGVVGLRAVSMAFERGVFGPEPTSHCLVDLVIDSEATLQAEPDLLDFLVAHLPAGALWLASVRGRSEVWPLQRRAVELGDVLRTGLEDTAYRRDGRRARDNAELVADLVTMVRDAGREVASPRDARTLLGLAA